MLRKQRKIFDQIAHLNRLQFSEDALTQLYNRTAIEPRNAIETLKSLNSQKQQVSKIEEFYGLKTHETDALNVDPLAWGLNLKEPDITKALVIFLNHKDHATKVARVNSFLKAIGSRFDEISIDDEIRIKGEFRGADHGKKAKRIDVMINWRKLSNKHAAKWDYGACIEVKVNGQLSKNPLAKYENNTKYTVSDEKNCEFFFLTREVPKNGHRILGSASEYWSICIWYRVLRNWEQNISEHIDDTEFRQFRSTLWETLS